MELTIRRPDDWHVHFRDHAMMEAVVPHTARHFARALVMPNLVPPVVTAAQAAEYRDRILRAKPAGAFRPLMTLYLTEETRAAELRQAAEIGLVTAVKLYPAGATTNSASGVKDLTRVMRVLETMAQVGLPLCVHGEVTDPEVDIFDREAAFIERVLSPLRRDLPELRIVMEHVTTSDAVAFVREEGIGATITVQHLMLDRNAMLVGGIRPHYYCLPILKRGTHRAALVEAATSGEASFFLGTDSAPHPTGAKEAACGCAGCFTAPVSLSCLAQVFEEAGALDRLEAFASLNGPAFYKLPPNEDRITLRRGGPIEIPAPVRAGDDTVTVFDPGRPVHWHVEDA